MKVKVRDAGLVRILEFHGPFKVQNSHQIRKAIEAQLDEGRKRLVLNLQHVAYTDSSGIGEMVACQKKVRDLGGDIKISEPSAKVKVSLGFFPQNFVIYDTDLKAVVSF
jgi:anti-anti-sigma factor